MFVKWLFRLIIVCLVVIFGAMLIMRFELMDSITLFLTIMLTVAVAALLAAISAVSVIVLLIRKRLVSGQLLSAIIIGLLPLATVVLIVGDGFSAPPIHDISTDLRNPPVFVHVLEDRRSNTNSLELEERVMAIQASSYPEIQSLHLDQSYNEAVANVEALVEALGWQVLGRSENPYQIEAVDKTALLGFKDDVAIRLTMAESGVIVDVRSASRVGTGDLGANALRIMRVLDGLKDRNGY